MNSYSTRKAPCDSRCPVWEIDGMRVDITDVGLATFKYELYAIPTPDEFSDHDAHLGEECKARQAAGLCAYVLQEAMDE